MTLSYFPLVFLPVAAALRGLDPGLEETAYALGLSRWGTFRRVVLPQLRPALLGGSLLVALHLLAEFGALQLLRYPTFTTAIYDQYESSFASAAATMLAGVLVLCCLLLLLAELRLRGHARYARLGGGAPRPATRTRLGALTPVALAGLGALVGLALVVPLGSLLRWLLTGASTAFDGGALAGATLTSLGLAAVAAAVTTLLAVPVAWLAVRHRGRLPTLLERSTYLGSALPGIVVALALVTIAIRGARPLYQTMPLLVAGYVILFLPRAVVTVRAALAQAPPVLDSVAHSLGAGPLGTLRRVTLPLIAPGLGAGAALVFLAVVTELTATLLLVPDRDAHPGDRVLAAEQQPRVRRRRAVRGADGAALRAGDLAAHPRSAKGDPAMTALTARRGDQVLRLHPGPRRDRPARARPGPSPRCSGRPGAARPRCCGWSPASTTRTPAPSPSGTSWSPPPAGSRPPQRRRVGYVPQEGALFPHLSVAANVCFGLSRKRPAGGGWRSCWSWSAWTRGWPAGTRTSSPAASSSGWRWPGRWRRGRRSCCWTSRSPRWTPACASPPGGRWRRR